MPPKLVSDEGDNVVVRPLIYCAEDDLAAFAAEERFPIIPCDLCGSQDNLQRRAVSRLLADLDAKWPGARRNMLAALGNVRPSHLFDKGLWAELGLEVAREAEGAETLGFDDADARPLPSPEAPPQAAHTIPAERLLRRTA